MSELKDTAQAPTRALLIGVRDESTRHGGIGDEEAQSLSKELAGLAKTLGVDIVERTVIRVRDSQPKFGMGSGKADEIAARAKELEADCIIFDQDITPSQQRNWEEIALMPVLDRQEVIIQIFAARAKTREASLQIELAQLKHSLPRLAHAYIDLSRQRGGRYGTKGSGETRLEMDRRNAQKRIHQLGEELDEVRKHRATQRKRREKDTIPTCALVGYTNAGKSSLLNAMTAADAFVEDKLFATLDPTTRRLDIGKGRPILLTDTVGFIRRLPHDLVDAFRSTLEEAAAADLIIQVLDASDPDVDRHYDTTMTVLKELDADKTPMIVVLNKCDLINDPKDLADLSKKYSESVTISATTGVGLDILARLMDTTLSGGVRLFRFPVDRHDLAAMLHRNGTVIAERYEDDRIEIEARVGDRTLGTLKEFLID
ncbi:MAG: GTPase HflX [Treponemataceae bacterium]